MLKVLGIESAATTASVAILEDDHLVAEYTTDYKKTHSQTLLPMIDDMSRMVGLEPATIDIIAVSGGPGSFTGLRIGSTTAKGLGLALDKKLVHVPTLDAMAYQLMGVTGLVCAMLDARKGNVFAGVYGCEKEFKVEKAAFHGSVEEVAEILNELGQPVTITGDGCDVYWNQLQEAVKVPVTKAPVWARRARAAAVAALGMEMSKAGQTEEARDHVPNYLRVSQAERQLAEAQKS